MELPEKEKQELEGLLWEEFLDFPTESELEESKLSLCLITLIGCYLLSTLPENLHVGWFIEMLHDKSSQLTLTYATVTFPAYKFYLK